MSEKQCSIHQDSFEVSEIFKIKINGTSYYAFTLSNVCSDCGASCEVSMITAEHYNHSMLESSRELYLSMYK